jgi:hypothetical protein
MGMDPRRSAFVVLGQVQECRTKPSIAGRQAAGRGAPAARSSAKLQIGRIPPRGRVGELAFIECDLHHAAASKR